MDKEDKTKTVLFTRPPDEACESYWATANMIEKLPKDDNFVIAAATLIKKHVHHEKLCVYSRLMEYTKHASIDWIKTILGEKVETHKTILENWDSGKYHPRG